ncbi:MAG: hypothetical protein WD883_01280 [Candidatus Colwellbacteria bacterium]
MTIKNARKMLDIEHLSDHEVDQLIKYSGFFCDIIFSEWLKDFDHQYRWDKRYLPTAPRLPGGDRVYLTEGSALPKHRGTSKK